MVQIKFCDLLQKQNVVLYTPFISHWLTGYCQEVILTVGWILVAIAIEEMWPL